MDLRLEAAAAAELAANFAGDPTFRVPRDRLASHRPARADPGADHRHPHRRSRAADRRRARYRRHPGQGRGDLLQAECSATASSTPTCIPATCSSTPTARIVVVDFGIMGRLDRATRHYLADMLLGFLRATTGASPRSISPPATCRPASRSTPSPRRCRAIGEPILGQPLRRSRSRGCSRSSSRSPSGSRWRRSRSFCCCRRTMLLVEGVGRRLDPELNIWTLARPLIEAMDARQSRPRGAARARRSMRSSRRRSACRGCSQLIERRLEAEAAPKRAPHPMRIAGFGIAWWIAALALLALLLGR